MEKNTNYQKLKEFIKKIISEDYFDDDDDDLGSFSGEFDPLEFKGAAMKAAKKDIGKEFEPLGKSRFEKNLNTDEFTKNLQRQNLNLPKDREEIGKIKGSLDKRYKHEKQFGVGSMNEIGFTQDGNPMGFPDDYPEEEEYHQPPMNFDAVNKSELADKMFTDLSQEFYVPEKDRDHISNIAIKRMVSDGLLDYDTEGDHDDNGHVRKGSIYSFYWLNDKGVAKIKSPQDIIDNYFYSSGPDAYEKAEKSHFSGSEGGGMDENLDEVDSNPYMKLSPQQAEHLKRINSTTLQSIIKHLNFLKVNPNTVGQQYKLSDWWDKLGYDEKHNRWYPVSVKHDMKKLVSHPINMNEEIPGSDKLQRTKDFEGNPIILKARIEDITTGMAGRVIRFGIDNVGKQTVHVEWIPKAGEQVPSPVTYPDKVVVRDGSIKIKEGEIDESSIRSHANGKGQNLKPGNYPETFKRKGLKENLDQATAIDNDVFLVIDNAFNRAHYRDIIGQTFESSPSYAQTKVVNLQDVEKEKAIKYDMDEDYDYAAEEREYDAKEELKDLADKNVKPTQEDYDYAAAEREHDAKEELTNSSEQALQYVPENLQQFLIQNSFKISQTDGDGRVEYFYILKIPKQADEQLKDIEKFIREEEPSNYTGPGQSYQKVNLYTELEKGTNNWVTKVNVVRGYDV